MTICHGVQCKTCGKLIKLGEPMAVIPESTAVIIPPLEPILCECGASHEYNSDDGIIYEED